MNSKELIAAAKFLKQQKLVSDGVNKGSISIRLDNKQILMSPSKLSYDELTDNKLNIVKADGTYVSQPSPSSRDTYFHLNIYQQREDVNCIIHTHSRYATALALAGQGIPFILYGMKFHCKGSVELAPFEFPDSPACNEKIIRYLGNKNAVLLENHGLICVGKTIKECLETVEFVEAISESYLHALAIGKVKDIKNWEVINYG